jgi:hypothetical protein
MSPPHRLCRLRPRTAFRPMARRWAERQVAGGRLIAWPCSEPAIRERARSRLPLKAPRPAQGCPTRIRAFGPSRRFPKFGGEFESVRLIY